MDASPQSSIFKVYIASGRAKDGTEFTKVGFSANPQRRFKRFAKRYGVDAEFYGAAIFHMPSRAMAYALEQAILYRCHREGMESTATELFVAPSGPIIIHAMALYKVMAQ